MSLSRAAHKTFSLGTVLILFPSIVREILLAFASILSHYPLSQRRENCRAGVTFPALFIML
jgi:hypothetical protein